MASYVFPSGHRPAAAAATDHDDNTDAAATAAHDTTTAAADDDYVIILLLLLLMMMMIMMMEFILHGNVFFAVQMIVSSIKGDSTYGQLSCMDVKRANFSDSFRQFSVSWKSSDYITWNEFNVPTPRHWGSSCT